MVSVNALNPDTKSLKNRVHPRKEQLGKHTIPELPRRVNSRKGGKMKTLGVSCFLLIIAVVFGVIVHFGNSVTSVHASLTQEQPFEGCFLGSVHGSFGISTAGSIVAFGPVGQVAEAGIISFDGKGNVSQTTTVSLNGTIVPDRHATGTYTVNTDCTGDLQVLLPTPVGFSPSTLHFVIVDFGRELRMVNTGNGRVLTSNARKIAGW